MPLITCPDCGRQISDRATICIGCGGPVQAGPPKPLTEAVASEPSPPPSASRPVGQLLEQYSTPPSSPPSKGRGAVKIILLMILVGIFLLAVSSQDEQAKGEASEMALYVVGFILSVYIYFIPAITAHRRNHRSRESITLLNIFLGWTLVGWVAALVWAVNPTNPASNLRR